MSGIQAVNTPSAAPVSAPQQAGHGQKAAQSQRIPGQGSQEDSLSISREALEALEDAAGALEKLRHHHRSHNETTLVLLTYPNFQQQGQVPAAVQAHQGGNVHGQGAAPAGATAQTSGGPS